jgi:hypothetical protein
VLVVVAWLLLALIRNVLMPAGQLRPVAAVAPSAGHAEVMLSKVQADHRHR